MVGYQGHIIAGAVGQKLDHPHHASEEWRPELRAAAEIDT